MQEKASSKEVKQISLEGSCSEIRDKKKASNGNAIADNVTEERLKNRMNLARLKERIEGCGQLYQPLRPAGGPGLSAVTAQKTSSVQPSKGRAGVEREKALYGRAEGELRSPVTGCEKERPRQRPQPRPWTGWRGRRTDTDVPKRSSEVHTPGVRESRSPLFLKEGTS